jgi:hypothetical protein
MSGAARQPASTPTRAATSATNRFSTRKVAATRFGVPPTAFKSPTRRVPSARRPPTRTATLASASRPSSVVPVKSTAWSLRRKLLSWSAVTVHEVRNGDDALFVL